MKYFPLLNMQFSNIICKKTEIDKQWVSPIEQHSL